MAEDDVTIGITVEDSTAMAKLAELQAELAKTQGAGMGGGAGSMRAGISVGQIFPAELEKMAAAGGRYKQVLNQVTGATNELSEETQKAGINIESMMTRMAIRMGLMEAVRLAIGGIVNAIKEFAVVEEERVHFENLNQSLEHLDEIEQQIKRTSIETNVAQKDLYASVASLREAGEGPEEVSDTIKVLGERSEATGIPVEKLAKGIKDLKLDTASVSEMFELASSLGTASGEAVKLVEHYQELERSIKRADHARAESLAALQEQITLEERSITAGEQAAAREHAATERAIADQERLAGVQESFLEKALGKAPGQADPLLMRAMQPGGLPSTAGGKQMTADIQAGFQEIYKEENLTTEGMQHYVNTGVIGLRDILAAAKRLHEAEKEARTEADQKEKQAAEDRKRALADQSQDARKQETETKKAEQVKLDNERLDLEKKIGIELVNHQNIIEAQAKAAKTLSEQWQTIWNVIRNMVTSQQGQLVMTGLAKFNPLISPNVDVMSSLNQMIQSIPKSIADDTKRTADATEGIHRTLTGAGTP